MTAMAAVAMGVAFTSCSHNTDLYGGEDGSGKVNGRSIQEQLELDKAVYKAAFEQTFGKVAPTVDWGFGSGSANTRAFTRVNTGDNYPQTSAGINANANEWADPEKEFGGWLVPDPLTEGQKERVRKYFQANPNPGNKDPQWRHFFVQQVYKGGTAQAGNSSENITAANNSVYNSDNMNLLTVGQNHQHINNFNAGTCSTNNEVLDNGGNVNDGPYHSDQIMLMVNIDDTSCFGYHETGSSTHHDNKWALVSAAVIDEWAAKNGNPGEAVVDKWNRSFMGFDLAIKEGLQACETDADGNIVYATYNQAPESPQYAWDGEKVVQITTGEWETVEVGNQWSTWTESRPVYKDEFKSIMGCGWLVTNENFYVADDKVTLDQSYQVNGTPENLDGIKDAVILKEFTVNGTKYQSVINLPKIKQLVDNGYLPVKDKSLQDWVKVGKSDGYFTDWIVTLTEAKRIDEQNQETPTYRVIAEDLTASQGSDFDFNDVVFDVDPNADGQGATVTILAAGGIWPLEINGEEVHQKLIPGIQTTVKYTHEGVEYDCYPMINTHEDGEKWINTGNKPTIRVTTGTWDTDDNIRNSIKTEIVLKVFKYGDTKGTELEANEGVAACKILVDKNYKINSERNNIASGTKFKDFVAGKLSGRVWW